jgi:uncharacterized protein YecT (DUF1311 family)
VGRLSLAFWLFWAAGFSSLAVAQEPARQFDCSDGGSGIVEEIYCSYREVEAADAKLSGAHAKQLSDQRKLVAEAKEEMFKRPEEEILATMIREQEAWSRYRQARCERVDAETRGGRLAQLFMNHCLRDEALLRLQRLDQ